MRIGIALLSLGALTACGGNKAANVVATNGAGDSSVAANAAGPAANVAAPAGNVAAGASPITPRPVLVGVDAELDKCPSLGRANGTRPVIVRAAPNQAAGEVGRIARATNVAICDQDDRENPQAEWFAIVYPETGSDLAPCRLDGRSAGNGGTPYAGTCLSGWVRATDIEVVAG